MRFFEWEILVSAQTFTPRLNQSALFKKVEQGEKIAMFTGYDASFAKMLELAGADCILIGDSLGNVIQGQDTTLPVTLADIIYHTKNVKRGCAVPFILSDMPFGSSQISPEKTFENAVQLMAAGAQMVKIEGGVEMVDTVRFLTSRGIPVCAHIGLTPQSVHVMGYKVQGKDEKSARYLKDSALALQDAGATMMVLEAIPSDLAYEITCETALITIGIGAGAQTRGQVLVIYDMLDIPPGKKAKFVRNFMADSDCIQSAITLAVDSIKNGSFPAKEHCY